MGPSFLCETRSHFLILEELWDEMSLADVPDLGLDVKLQGVIQYVLVCSPVQREPVSVLCSA